MSDRPEAVVKSVRAWFEHVEADLDTAVRALAPPARHKNAAVLAQQAAEKAMKAYLIWLGLEEIPWTHNLLRLHQLLIEHGGAPLTEEFVDLVNEYGPRMRYPDQPGPPAQRAPEVVMSALRLVTEIRRRIAGDSEQGSRAVAVLDPASPRVWMEYAEDDLDALRLLSEEPRLAPAASFWGQQAAEKALKAYLVSLGLPCGALRHDLLALADRIVELGGQAAPREPLRRLNPLVDADGYPAMPPPTEEEAYDALDLAEQVVRFVRQALGFDR